MQPSRAFIWIRAIGLCVLCLVPLTLVGEGSNRWSRAELLQILPENPAGVGARIDDRAAWQRATRLPTIRRVVWDAHRYLGEPIPVIDDDVIRASRRLEDRQIYEVPLRLRTTRLNAFVLAECVENTGAFLPAIERELSAILEEGTWCIGGLLTDEVDRSKRTFIDLAASARAWTVATAAYWLGDRLAPELRQRIRDQLNERIFEPYLADAAAEKKRFFWMEAQTNNWGPVCHAGVVGAALAMLDSREDRVRILEVALQRLDGYLNGWSMARDGLCIEGVGYWDYGFGNYLLLAETLWQHTDGQINLYAGPRVRQIATTVRELELSDGTYVPFSDTAIYMRPNVALLWLIKERFGLTDPWWPDAPDGVAQTFHPDWAFQDLPGRPDTRDLAGALFALHPQTDRLAAYGLFAFPGKGGVANVGEEPSFDVARSIFAETGRAILRHVSPGQPTLALGIKAGHNDEPHGHHDQGSYVISVAGWPLLLDPGSELYTLATFDGRRFDSMMNNSLGHPVPIVAGQPQRDGADARSILTYRSEGAHDVVELDLTACYDVPALERLTRTFRFDRSRREIEIVDNARFSKPSNFATAFVTNSSWQHRDTGFVVWDGGYGLTIQVESETGPLEVVAVPVTAPRQRPGIAPVRITYQLREPAASVRIKASIQLADRGLVRFP